MKRTVPFLVAALIVAAVAVPSIAKEGAAKHKAMAHDMYMVIAPHDAAQCLKALDDTKDTGGLAKWSFGCEDGDHTGYRMCSAASAEEALKNVPADERAGAKAIKMHHFTAAELKGIHEKMAAGK